MICECCKQDTLTKGNGNFEICRACNWEDDPVQNANPLLASGANFHCLMEHRALFLIIRSVIVFAECGGFNENEKMP
jgi:hypothetical protein